MKMCCETCIWWLRNPYVEDSVPVCLRNQSSHYHEETAATQVCGCHDRKPEDKVMGTRTAKPRGGE